MRYCRTFFPRVTPYLRARRQGLDGGHAPAGIALMAGEASGLLDAWASSPGGSLRPLLLEGDDHAFVAPTPPPREYLWAGPVKFYGVVRSHRGAGFLRTCSRSRR